MSDLICGHHMLFWTSAGGFVFSGPLLFASSFLTQDNKLTEEAMSQVIPNSNITQEDLVSVNQALSQSLSAGYVATAAQATEVLVAASWLYSTFHKHDKLSTALALAYTGTSLLNTVSQGCQLVWENAACTDICPASPTFQSLRSTWASLRALSGVAMVLSWIGVASMLSCSTSQVPCGFGW